jgi:hypothetical protein
MKQKTLLEKNSRGFDRYIIRRDGRIYSKISQRFLTCNSLAGAGYKIFSLQDNARRKRTVYLHRLLAEKFLPNPNGYKEVNHKNGDKLDNRIENLEWCSHKMNMQHAWKNDLISAQTGAQASKAKLDLKQIREIIKLIDGGYSNGDISKQFQIARSSISNIRTGKTYRKEISSARKIFPDKSA